MIKSLDLTNVVLDGAEALEHFLVCYQLLLWKQTAWLIGNKSYPAELEDVVRNRFWHRRLELLSKAGVFAQPGEGTDATDILHSQSGLEMTGERPLSRRRAKELPGLEDTLSMLYLALIYMHLPTTVADAASWVMEKGFPYLRAEVNISGDMMIKLPLAYRKSFYATVSLLFVVKSICRSTAAPTRLQNFVE